MTVWLRLSLALVIAALAGILGFMVVLNMVVIYGSCPSEVHTCDLPMIAGFGLGVITAPLFAIGAGVWSFRRIGRRGMRHDEELSRDR